MDTGQEIERAIDSLPPEQLEELSLWFEERYSQTVDERLKADIEAGRFDERIDRAIVDHKAGRTEPLERPVRDDAPCDRRFLERPTRLSRRHPWAGA
jgi:hypothetical protein